MQSGEPVNRHLNGAWRSIQPGDRGAGATPWWSSTIPSTAARPSTSRARKGEVHTVLNDWKGRVISPNLPVIVAFGKFRAHFRDNELERA
jgi:hypothetical protein